VHVVVRQRAAPRWERRSCLGFDGWCHHLIPDDVYNRVETLRQAIIAGLIQVPRVPERGAE
jgi:hypothetical protein